MKARHVDSGGLPLLARSRVRRYRLRMNETTSAAALPRRLGLWSAIAVVMTRVR